MNLEKYIRIRREFPNKAIQLKKLIEVQKRQVEKLMGSKQSDDVQKLILASAESYDVTRDLLNWTYQMFNEVSLDAEALIDGAKMRDQIKLQSDLIKEFYDIR